MQGEDNRLAVRLRPATTRTIRRGKMLDQMVRLAPTLANVTGEAGSFRFVTWPNLAWTSTAFTSLTAVRCGQAVTLD
jgi:hypothetical protein